MMKKWSISLAAMAIFATANGVQAEAVSKDKIVPLQMLSMNDLHGYIEGNNDVTKNGKAIGGLDSLAFHFQNEENTFTKVNKLKANNANNILVQSGDLVGGSPATSSLLQDQPTMNAINEIGFDVGTLGNHEFDEGINEFKRILSGTRPNFNTPNYENIFDYTQTKSKMSMVVSNIIDKKTKKIVGGFKPYTIKTVDGVKIAFIGVVTPNIHDIVMEQHTKNIEVIDPAKAIAKYTKELRSKGVKAITVVAHAGAEMNKEANTSIETQSLTNVSGEVVSILRAVNKLDPKNSIDVVFAGHSHKYVNGTYKKTRIVQGLNYGNAYGVVKGKLSTKTKDFIATPSASIKYNFTQSTSVLKKNKQAKKVQTIIADAKKRVASVTSSTIATTTVPRLNSVPEKDGFGTVLGNLVTDAQLNMAIQKKYPTDLAITNTGGIRTDLIGIKSNSGYKITWGAAQAVQPFQNFLQHAQLTGAQIKQILNEQFDNGDRKLEVAGIYYTYNQQGVKEVYLQSTEQPLESQKRYNIVVNDFLIGGKDQYPTFKKAINKKTIAIDTEIFIEYLQHIKKVDSTYKSRAIFVK